MRRSIYRELTTSLLADCRSAISEFAASHHNRDVFAFVLDCDPFHGAVNIGINTREGLQNTLDERYPKAKPNEIDGLHGIKYRCEDFPFNDFGLCEESLQLLDEIAATQHDAKTDRTAERHADMLLLTLARVVLILDADLAALDQTDDFVAFVTEVDASEASRIALIRRTVSETSFDRVFPEIRAFESRLAEIAQLPPDKRAAYWVKSAQDLACENDTEDVKRFRETGRNADDLLDSLVELGSVGVAPLVASLEKLAPEPQLNGTKSKAFRENGPQTASCRFSLQAIERIRAIRLVDEDNVARLNKLLRKLHRRDKDKKAGPIAAEIARLLHETRPHLYPQPVVHERTMALKNAADFGLK